MFVSFIRKGKQGQQPCRHLVRSYNVVSTARLPLWSPRLCHLLGLQGPVASLSFPVLGDPSPSSGEEPTPQMPSMPARHICLITIIFLKQKVIWFLTQQFNRKLTQVAKCQSSYFRVLVNKMMFSKTKPFLVSLLLTPEGKGKHKIVFPQGSALNSQFTICLEPKGCLDTFSHEHTEESAETKT